MHNLLALQSPFPPPSPLFHNQPHLLNPTHFLSLTSNIWNIPRQQLGKQHRNCPLPQHNAQSLVQMAHQVQPTGSNPAIPQASLLMAEQPMPMDPRMPGVTQNSVLFDQQTTLLAQPASLPTLYMPNTQTTAALPFQAPAFSTQPQQHIQVSQRPPPPLPCMPYAPWPQTIQPYTVELNPNALHFPTASTAPTCTGPTQEEPNALTSQAVPIIDADTRNGEEREAAGEGANLAVTQRLDEDSNVRMCTVL
ncbi:hypothetical protein BN14_07653 [Rhizoctonia solani AG-1 IB]|uniref:Uncharacterized protein n=1 Tax=Thanatephorus cucumeris (strain AG1-IB / isolate 7/3/14) TaxID=1108050 RepID=M5C2H1_THACB|nr:hypothetical protein BN14_07653 [Rhizoctonia solani AG-1 IB]